MTMRIDAEIKDGKKVFAGLRLWPSEMSKAVTDQLVVSANEIRKEMIVSMRNTPKTGIKYRRGRKFHIASSPGNPPAIDTGELLRSMAIDVRPDSIEVGALVGAPYAPFLEGGTTMPELEEVGGVEVEVFKLAPRPFLQPALEKLLPKMNKDLITAIGESTRNVFGA